MKRILLLFFFSGIAFGGPLIVAHRGASYDAPENTLAAFHLAWEQGADAIEGDFFLSGDGEVVCIHDANTKKTGGKKLEVAKTDLKTLRQLDVGSWKGKQWAGESIPTLAEVLAIVPAGKQIFIEIKSGPETIPPAKTIIEASGLTTGQVTIISFKAEVIAAAKASMPEIPAFWIAGVKRKGGVWVPDQAKVEETLRKTKADGFSCNIEPAFVRAILPRLKSAGYGSNVWTVNKVGDARFLVEQGVDSITTDRPAYIRKGLRAVATP